MRIAALILSVCLVSVVDGLAQSVEVSESQAVISSDDSLAKVTYRAGTSTIDVRAERGVNIQDVLAAAKVRPTDDGQTIVQKVDAARQRLYPDREFALTVSLPRSADKVTSGVYVWRYYLAWNRTGRIYYYWSPLLAAATFISDVRGTWKYYECNGCSVWAYRATIGTGGTYTRALAGGYMTRGFDYRPQTYGARADIVMYFFN